MFTNRRINRTFFFAIIISFFSAGFIFAEKTKIDGLFRYRLDNGLELYVAENHSVPLAYVELAVRAGAISQTKETSGLFHLYEHMMFKGNALYRDAASVNKALADLGVTSHNGSTSTDCVNYYFTIPSDKIEEGLAFWNAAVRTPLITEKEFENEKKVVLSEIEGDLANPSYVLHYYSNLLLFPEDPCKTDPSGSYDVVRNATVAQMRNMQRDFYIPCNAAIFVGGDVDPDETFALVKKIYGTWKNGSNAVSQRVVSASGSRPSVNPLSETKFIVMPFDKLSKDLAEIDVRWRGPDLDYDYENSVYSAYLQFVMRDPDSALKTRLAANGEYKIPDQTYVGCYTNLGRKNSIMGAYALVTDPETDLISRTKKIAAEIQNEIYPSIAADKKQFAGGVKRRYKNSIEDTIIQSSETAENLVTLARSCWIDGDIEYFLENKKSPAIKQKKVQEFVDDYIVSKNALVTVLVNPEVYARIKSQFASAGFYEVKNDEPRWWKKNQFKVDVSAFPKTSDFVMDKEVYVPELKINSDRTVNNSRNVDVVQLDNGIKVYVQHTSSKMNAIAIGCMGGYEKYAPEYSGLEGCLFDVMASSSAAYPMEKRNQMQYLTGVSIDKYNRSLGTVLYMYGMEKYFDGMMPAFIDGFINPVFADNVVQNINDGNKQRVQKILNDPASLLAWTVNKDVYKNHPYQTTGGVNPDSIDNITVEKMQEVHKDIIAGGNFFIAATGTFNTNKLKKKLNKTIGKLVFDPARKYEMKKIPPLKIEKKAPVVISHQNALGAAYCARVFASPDIYNPDAVPAVLAGSIFTDIMHNVVREHHGVCYGPHSNVITSKAPMSEDYLFKVTGYGKIGLAMREAQSYMSKGFIVEKSNDDGTYEVSPIADCIESYKSRWLNATYSASKTTSGQMSRIMSNIMYYDDIDYDLKEVEQLKALTADDVVRVFNKYWLEGNATWYAITFPGNEKNLVF
ncbi:MAG: insulinase family protein [Treponema sp.]|nr:insulinase family protein [Candidatus Treponema equi]